MEKLHVRAVKTGNMLLDRKAKGKRNFCLVTTGCSATLSFICEVYESMLQTGVSANSEKQGDSCLTNVSKCRSNVVEQTLATCATAV